MAASVDELKQMIVNLRLDLVKAKIPKGHCPYAYYHIEKSRDNCEDCTECNAEFFAAMKKKIEAEVLIL